MSQEDQSTIAKRRNQEKRRRRQQPEQIVLLDTPMINRDDNISSATCCGCFALNCGIGTLTIIMMLFGLSMHTQFIWAAMKWQIFKELWVFIFDLVTAVIGMATFYIAVRVCFIADVVESA